MDWAKSLKHYLSRKVTILIVPQADFKTWRWQCSTDFLLVCLILWSGMTLWAGYLSGRHIDYWITKADNQVMMAKMTYLAQEMEKSHDILEMAKSTDEQLRGLLGLSQRRGPAEGQASMGGPSAADQASLRRLLAVHPSIASQPDWRRQMAAIREESYKRLASFQEIAWYIGNQRSLFQATPNLWPTEGSLTSSFGYRFSPIQRSDGETGEYHNGIDIANVPDTLISVTADGTVRHAGWSHGYGKMVVIDHGYGLSTLYAHTSKTLVKTGDRVSRGQVIAYMGTTGRSTGAHLHYEVWRHGKPVDPMIFLKAAQRLPHGSF